MSNVLQVPPSPPAIGKGSGGGGGRSKPPWQLWIALALIALSTGAFSLLLVRAAQWQPMAASLSVAWAVVWLIITHRRRKTSTDGQLVRYFAWVLVGGMVAVLIQALVAGPAMGLLWLILGAVGIGGGFGIGAASLAYSWYAVVALARILLAWRAA